MDQYRSGETSLNCERFNGLTCDRNEAVKTNWPTELENLGYDTQRVNNTSQNYIIPSKKRIERIIGDKDTI